jgi:putative heme-binding domain-containing protein
MRSLVLGLLLVALAAAQQRDVIPADIEEGARNFANLCAQCHGADGNAMPAADLTRSTLPRAATDDQLARVMLGGIPGTAMPPNALNQRQVFTLVQYIRSLASAPRPAASGGNVARGQAVFEGKGNCLSCHRVRDRGSFAAPDLSEIGLVRRTPQLERALLDPGADVLPQNATVVAVTQGGATIRGRTLNADTHTMQIMDATGRLHSLSKDQLRSLTREPGSAMPAYGDRLTRQEIADVVAYLSTLRGL